MQNRMRIIAGMLSLTLLAGCTGYDTTANADGINYAIAKNGTKAFVSEISWDGEKPLKAVIPEQINGASVTTLGGFYGSGVPMPFQILAEENAYDFTAENPNLSEYGAPVIFEDIPVDISLPKTVTDVNGTVSNGWFVSRNEYGESVFRRPAVRFMCSDENPEFAAENGVLIQKEDGSEVKFDEGFYAETPVPAMTLREKLCGRYVKEGGDEKDVYDVFSEFGKVYIHISSYMEDSLYMFNALELIPLEEDILAETDTNTFECEVHQFSDFAMGGEYTDPGAPYYRITVLDNALAILELDVNRNPYMDSGIELPKDNKQPSQYLFRPEDLARVNTDNGFLRYPDYYTLVNLTQGKLVFDDGEMRICRDGTITLRRDAENTAIVFRGLVMGSSKYEDYDLRFVMAKTGGTTEPYAGRVHFEINKDGTVIFTSVDGFEHTPLIPEGTDSLTCRLISNG